jgi:ABC-2 type transport system ATP-binding protein
MTYALEVRGLRKAFGRRQALDGLDLTVSAGTICGLVGANGAGKTTFMSICAGLLRTDAGAVNLLGDGPFDPAIHAGRVAILPQDARPPPHARVAELLTFYGRLQGVPESALRGHVADLLRWVNLADRARSPVGSLSHGMLRRLTVAQAFLGEPPLVFLDEPMSGLDPREVARMRELLLRRRGTQTIVISSHVLTELETLCASIAFIDHGRLLRHDSLAAIVHHRHRLTYRIHPGAVPLEALRRVVPKGEWILNADGTELSILLEDGADALAAVNTAVLPLLLQAGIAIEEIRRGSDLETEFLAATETAPVP